MTASDAFARIEAALSARPKPLGEQFIPITQLQAMKANDLASDQYTSEGLKAFNHVGLGPEHRDATVGELSRSHPFYSHPNRPYDWDRLSRDYDTGEADRPLTVGIPNMSTPEERLLNGHHRAIMAMERGRMFVPVIQGGENNVSGERTGKYQTMPFSRPNRTWEPLLQEHEADTGQPTRAVPQNPGQGQLFKDRR